MGGGWERAARAGKAGRVAVVLARMGLSAKDLRLLVEDHAPVLEEVARQAGVRTPSVATWEAVATLLECRATLPADPFSVFDS